MIRCVKVSRRIEVCCADGSDAVFLCAISYSDRSVTFALLVPALWLRLADVPAVSMEFPQMTRRFTARGLG